MKPPKENQKSPYQHIAIVGTGLIGGSLARLIRYHFPNIELTGVSRRLAAAKDAVTQGVIDNGYDSINSIESSVDLAIICTPIDTIPAFSKALFAKGVPVISDIGSTKSYIAKHPDCQPPKDNQLFIPGHPMAGNELRGFENSTQELLDGCNYLVCPPKNATEIPAYTTFTAFLRAMDFSVIEIDAEKHDHLVGLASHLPYFMACATVEVAKSLVDKADFDTFQRIVSTGFASTTRVSGSDPNWGKDIAETNHSAIEKGLQEAANTLTKWRSQIKNQNLDALKSALQELSAFRNKFGRRN